MRKFEEKNQGVDRDQKHIYDWKTCPLYIVITDWNHCKEPFLVIAT